MVASTCDVFVGSEIGLLKGVHSTQKGFQNLNDIRRVDKRKDEIELMCWGTEPTQVCCGLKDRSLKLYHTTSGVYESVLNVDCGKGSLKGLSTYNGNFLTCDESGVVKVWNKPEEVVEQKLEFNVGENICRMRHNSFLQSQIGTGGKENELKIWDLEASKQPIFKAKNVKRDSLDLRIPVWITDIQFLSEGQKILTVTGHHQIRLYDPKAPQKRPVIEVEFDEYPLTSVAVANQENYVIVGNTRGRMAMFDLRKKLMVHCYKGFAGSIRSVQCHPTLPQVASCGLDRFLRIHHIHSHTLLQKYYMKSRLNCLLFRQVDEAEKTVEEYQPPFAVKSADNVNDDVNDVWNEMEQASDDELTNPLNDHTQKASKKRKRGANKKTVKRKTVD